MKIFPYFILFFFVISCAGNKSVYWCGDHPCINKKEREAYFRATMIVEVRDIEKNYSKKDSENEKIMNQAKVNEKNRIKEEKEMAKREKLEEKNRIKEEKEMAKREKLEEKDRIKEEEELAKQIQQDERKLIREKNGEKKQLINENLTNTSSDLSASNFKKLADEIIKRNSSRSYPEISDIPN